VITKNYLTAKKRQDIRFVAELLGNIIPGTSRGSFSFQNISLQRKITKKYWTEGKNKKEQISNFLLNIYRYHPNLIYKIIRENISKGIERRHKAGAPVLKEEITSLDQSLKRLGINCTKELFELNLPEERPDIVPPPYEYQEMLKKVSLETDISDKSKQLFIDGHINESVRKALEIFENKVQTLSGLDIEGKDLMMQAFNENNPLIKVADINTREGKSFQEGFRFIAAGSMMFLRNKFSHGNKKQESYIDGFQMLLTANQLLREVNKIG